MKNSALLLIPMLLAGSCGGHTPNPISSYKYGDEDLSCDDLQFEVSKMEREIKRKYGEESNDAPKNVALGVAGAFLIVPWFFMDFSDDELVEIYAYRDRMEVLQRISHKKGCKHSPQIQDALQNLNQAIEGAKGDKKEEESYTPTRRKGARH